MTNIYSQFPTPLHSPFEEHKPTQQAHSGFNFPIFHQDFASNPSLVFHNNSPFCINPVYIRPGEAVHSLDNRDMPIVNRARANSFPRSHHEMDTGLFNSSKRQKFDVNYATLHAISSFSAPQDDAFQRQKQLQSNPNIFIQGYNHSSPYSSEAEDMDGFKNSRKKSSVNPNSYQFTSQSSRMTDPVKFDKFVISFLKSRGRPVAKMPSVDKKWLSFWSLFHGKSLTFFLYILAVHEFGGSDVVTKGRKWKQVAHKLLLPATLTSASYTLRTFFTKYLLEFEHFYVNHTMKETLDIYRDDLKPNTNTEQDTFSVYNPCSLFNLI